MNTHSDAARLVEEAIARFHKDQQGMAPASVAAWIVDDMVIVRLGGVFTQTERSLVETTDGRKIVQSARRELRALTRRQVEAEVGKAVGVEVQRSFCDLDVRIAEQVEIYMLSRSL